jgi:hypothetical protein
VHLAFRRHVDHQVALYQSLATQAVIVFERVPPFAESLLDLARR